MSGNRTYETAGGVVVQEQILDDGTIVKIITAPDGESITVTERLDGTVETSETDVVAIPVELPSSVAAVDLNEPPVESNQQDNSSARKFSLKSLEYPIADNANRPKHFVRFFINLDEESKIIQSKSVDFEDVDQSDQNRIRNTPFDEDTAKVILGGATGVQVGATVARALSGRKFVQKSSKFKGRSAALAGAAAGGAIAFALETKVLDITKKLKRLKTSVTLYMPSGLNVGYKLSYKQTDDKLAEILSGDKGQDLANIMAKEGVTGPAAEIAKKLTRILAVAASDTVQNLTRTAYNKKVDVLFDRVDNRTFNFEFDFYPKTSEEAFTVAEIIYQFKLYSHPEIIDGLEQYLFIYPAEFDIEYGIRDENGNERDNIFLNKISSCVLTGLNVSYAASGGSYQSLRNGEPIHTKMNLQFMEIETLHRGRIEAGL